LATGIRPSALAEFAIPLKNQYPKTTLYNQDYQEAYFENIVDQFQVVSTEGALAAAKFCIVWHEDEQQF
jgi:hypothetical protein